MSVEERAFFQHVSDKWQSLVDQGHGVPQVFDPQLGNEISRWERSDFETFMRRVKEARKTSARALRREQDDDLDAAVEIWAKLYGDLWPAEEEVKALAKSEGERLQPGTAKVAATGAVGGASGVTSHRTQNWGVS